MRKLNLLWKDQTGVVISSELVMVATILVIGMIVGLTTVRDQVIQELGDVAAAIATTNQSYSFSAITGHHSSVAGSVFADATDDCDFDPICLQPDVCIALGGPATSEN